MVEYPIEEARELLQNNLKGASKYAFLQIQRSLSHLMTRDQVVGGIVIRSGLFERADYYHPSQYPFQMRTT